MSSWQAIRLGDALSVSHGCAFKGEYFQEQGDLIVMTPGNFREEGGFKDKDGKEKYYDGPLDPRFLLMESQVVVAMTEQSKGLLGSTATIPCDNVYLHNQRIGLINIEDPSRLDLRFVYHLLNAPPVRQQIQATATGSKVRHTAPARLEALEAMVPDVDYQQKVGTALDGLEFLIENNRRRIEILEELASLLYREWFVHFRFPGHDVIEFVDSDLGPIPEGWHSQPFSQAAEFVNGFAFKPTHWREDGLPIVKIKELKNGVSPATPRYHGLDIKKKYFVDNGSVLFSWSADLDAYMWSSGPALLNQHLFDVRPREVSLSYIYLALKERMPEFRLRAQGTTMRHIKRSALDEVQLAVAPQQTREEFEGRVGPMLELRLNLEHQVQFLVQARGLLLPLLVSGELDISDLGLELEAVGV